MKYSISSIYDKFTAMIVLILVTIVSAGCVLGVYYLFQYNFYTDDGVSAWQSAMFTKVKVNEADIEDYLYAYFNADEEKYDGIAEAYEEKYSENESNLFFTVSDSNGNTVLSNYSEEDYQFKYEKKYSVGENSGTVSCYVRSELKADDGYRITYRLIRFGNSVKYIIIILLVILAVILITLLSMIAHGAGDMKEDGQVSMGFVDKIPFDIFTASTLGLLWVEWLCLSLTEVADSNMVLFNVVVFFVTIITVLILLMYLSTLSVRMKVGNLFQNTLIYRLYALFSKKKSDSDEEKKSGSSYYRKLIVAIIILAVAELAVILYFEYRNIVTNDAKFVYYFAYWIVSRVISIPIIVVAAMNLAYVHDTSKKLADGNLDENGDTPFMFKGFRIYNRNLEQIRKEISKSVESEMKNERLKNEMITNLSHDIKTPLTSIIGCADLLEEDDNSQEQNNAYIEVIKRQSKKLEKLLDNLIEFSKLSNGDIIVEKETMNVGLLLSQIVGEFQYALEEDELRLVCDEVETTACISADGDLLWRILDNLMSNVSKYAQKGTEVYLETEITGDKVKIMLRNTSAAPIYTDGDELLERFVRDDSSRHTEGDGLGLSIAKRLTELQGGKIEVSVEGSLFEATLIFDRIYDE